MVRIFAALCAILEKMEILSTSQAGARGLATRDDPRQKGSIALITFLVCAFHKTDDPGPTRRAAIEIVCQILNVDIRRLLHICKGAHCPCKGCPAVELKRALKAGRSMEFGHRLTKRKTDSILADMCMHFLVRVRMCYRLRTDHFLCGASHEFRMNDRKVLIVKHPGKPSLVRWTTMYPCMACISLWMMIGGNLMKKCL